jgi:hypothetical protein
MQTGEQLIALAQLKAGADVHDIINLTSVYSYWFARKDSDNQETKRLAGLYNARYEAVLNEYITTGDIKRARANHPLPKE